MLEGGREVGWLAGWLDRLHSDTIYDEKLGINLVVI